MAIQIHKVLGVLHETWEEEANFLAARQLVWRSSQSLPSLRGSKIARISLVTQNLSCSVLPSFLNNAWMSEMAYCHLLGLREPNGLIAAISKTKDYFKNLPLPTQLRLIPSSVPIFKHPQNLNPISSSGNNLNPPEATRQSPLRDPK